MTEIPMAEKAATHSLALPEQHEANRYESFPTIKDGGGNHGRTPDRHTHQRKLIVLCDGTMNSDIEARPITNVVRLARCISPVDQDGIPQIVWYHAGVGTGTSRAWNLVEAATGTGLYENILGAYSFICNNYATEHDEVHLIGFSRGAFTVCCVARLIHDIGLLTKGSIDQIRNLIPIWKKGPENLAELQATIKPLIESKKTRIGVRIKSCAVWDTVSSLGLPSVGLLPLAKPRELKFIHSALCENIEHAIQALAIHEHRRPFEPIVWKSAAKNAHQKLTQCWFLGYHSDVGGGNDYQGLSHLALIWMIDQLNPYLLFDSSLLVKSSAPGSSESACQPEQVPDCSVGKDLTFLPKKLGGGRSQTTDSMKGIFLLAGSKARRPCQYFWREDGPKPVPSPDYTESKENMHFSVRALLAHRIIKTCPALESTETGTIDGKVMWTFGKKGSEASFEVPEAAPTPNELDLLSKWLDVGPERLPAETVQPSKLSGDGTKFDLRDQFKILPLEGKTPHKHWSSTRCREEAGWKKLTKGFKTRSRTADPSD